MPIHFEHIEYILLFVVLLPVITVWYWWEWRKKGICAKMAGNPRMLQTLLHDFNSNASKYRLLIFTVLISGIVFALMNPRIIKEKANVNNDGVEVMLAIDVSNSMHAADVAPNRFEKTRSFAIRLAEGLGGSRIGLIAFAGEARLQMPPTTDISAIKQALQTLSYASVPLQGTNIASALIEANSSLSADEVSYKALVVLTDGEELDGDALSLASKYAKTGMVVYVVGVGTREGYLLVDPDTGLPITDGDDQQVLSMVNETLLAELADATGGEYFLLADMESGMKRLTGNLSNLEKLALPNENLINYSSLSPYILLFVLLLQVLQLLWPFLMNKFLRKSKAITSTLLCFILNSLVAFGQPEKNDLAAGNEAYKVGKWEQAVEAFSKALQTNPANIEAKFYKGLAAYKMERFSESASDFAELAATGQEIDTRTASFNNAGLSLAREGKLAEAIDALKQAFRANPTDAEIKHNLQKALMDLKQQQQEEPKEDKKPPPPLKEQDANRKLQSVMEEERKTREKMKPRGNGTSNDKNW